MIRPPAHTLSALVERLSGMPMLDYLKENCLFWNFPMGAVHADRSFWCLHGRKPPTCRSSIRPVKIGVSVYLTMEILMEHSSSLPSYVKTATSHALTHASRHLFQVKPAAMVIRSGAVKKMVLSATAWVVSSSITFRIMICSLSLPQTHRDLRVEIN